MHLQRVCEHSEGQIGRGTHYSIFYNLLRRFEAIFPLLRGTVSGKRTYSIDQQNDSKTGNFILTFLLVF